MMTFTTIIPKCYNAGRPVSAKIARTVLNGLAVQFGGYTIDGDTEGCWVDPVDGVEYRDAGTKVTVSCEPNRLAEAEQVVIEIGRRLKQRAMYFEVRYADGVRILKMRLNEATDGRCVVCNDLILRRIQWPCLSRRSQKPRRSQPQPVRQVNRNC